ncbi:hypothetical protein KQX54_000517, partial [Cotesia glomerata]
MPTEREKSVHPGPRELLPRPRLRRTGLSCPDETYHIEPSWRHLPHLGNDSMIIYKASDVKLSWEHVENGEGHTHGVPKTCGYIKEVVDDGDDDQDQGEDFEKVEITLEEDTDYNNETDSDKLS